jgi:enamine deaminase RidA (YjgF/YER057c/UK114 family)
MHIEDKLKELNITIPDAPTPVGAYVAYKVIKNLIFISGQLPVGSDGNIIKGKLGKDLTVEKGQEAAKLCAINLIAQAKKAVGGDLSKIKSCVKITGFVNSSEDFIDQPKVLNAASELLTAVFGDNGKHARAAVSTNSLPLGIAVEIDAIFETN